MDTQTFLNEAAGLQVSELERLARELDAIITRKKTAQIGQRESQLVQLINHTILTTDQRQKYGLLMDKLEQESITEEERQEFLELVAEDEQLRNDRVKYLVELAQLRNISLTKLMADLGLDPIAHG